MNRREILTVSILLIVAALACLLLAAPYLFPSDTVDDDTSVKNDLNYLNASINTALTAISGRTESAAETLSSADSLSAPEMQPVLDSLFSEPGYAMSYAVITPDGTIAAVAPDAYAGSVGIHIGENEPGKTIIRMREPFLSDAFVAQEGFTGIGMAYPVFSDAGEYIASVLAMAEPSAFVGDIVAPVEEEKGITVTVMQPDGFILYDNDSGQIGKNLFEDKPFTNYPSLQRLGKNISANATGNGEYTFYASPEKTGDAIQKHANWDTLSFLGKEWRIIIFQNKSGK